MSPAEYHVETNTVTEPEWCELLDRFDDANIYQTWAYGSVRWGEKNLSHLILKRNGEVVGIAQLRIVRPKYFKLGIAYLRWGPLCQLRGDKLDASEVQAMAAALREEFVQKRGLYLEILPNAFSDSERAEIFRSAFSQFDHQCSPGGSKYRTLLLDLCPCIDELRKKLDKKWRNQLNAAERNGLSIVAEQSIEFYDAFCKLYTDMRDRKQFDSTVSIEEFRNIQKHLPSNQRMEIWICEHEKQPVAGLVSSVIGDSAIYLLGATNETGRKLKAAYHLHWAMISSLKARHLRYYDLGGINPTTNPGVYHFKAGFSANDVSHISPFVACDNGLSAAFVKSAQAMRSSLRRFQLRFNHA